MTLGEVEPGWVDREVVELRGDRDRKEGTDGEKSERT